ncbi:MAG TPA: cysteine desulfurase [Kofleriaceae bacterium]|jgi:cysteine desulfurase/selenocysteine lyase|nr:cysteine desulfurase [Kofleriaceae bacterium]
MTEPDVVRIRRDFAFTDERYNDKPVVYLDSAATAQKPRQVTAAMDEYHEKYAANVHRGVYRIAERATHEMELARDKVKQLLNARSTKEIIFTSGTTAGVNLVSYAWGLKGTLHAGDEIVVSVMEHHSNMVPWFFLRQKLGVEIKFVGVRPDGTLDLEQLDQLLGPRTRLVAITHCSNVLGTINPVKEIARRAHAVGALCLVDGAQSAPHMAVDVQDLGCDFFVFSGHKLPGPTGIGVLYGREEVLDAMEPFMGGGEMIREVKQSGARWNDLPWKFEAGTPNIAGAIGLGAAVDYLRGLDLAAVRAHEVAITTYALDQLARVPHITIYGPLDVAQRGGVVSFTLGRAHPHDIASILDEEEGVCVRAGHHCCHPLMDWLGIAATARASFYVYTLREEVDRLVSGLQTVNGMFNR